MNEGHLTVSCDSCGQEYLQAHEYFHHCSRCQFDLCSRCVLDEAELQKSIDSTDEDVLIEIDCSHPGVEWNDSSEFTGSYGLVDQLNRNRNNNALFSTIAFLRGHFSALDSLTFSHTFAANILYSRECVNSILCNWPKEAMLGPDVFGSTSAYFTYLVALYTEENKKGNIDRSLGLQTMCGAITEMIQGKKKACTEFTSALVGFSVQQISDSLKYLTTLKKTRAKVKVLESRHPYSDDLDEVTELSIPGAKYLKIVFDKRSATERGADFVEIYKDRNGNSGNWNSSPYTGRRRRKFWAGVDGVPACIVKSDTCWIHFRTDGSDNDWGYKLTCYGIMEEADENEKEEEREMLEKFENTSGLACWILDVLYRNGNAAVLMKIFSSRIIRSLRRYVEIVPTHLRLQVISLVITMANQIHRIFLGEGPTLELDALKKSLVQSMEKQYEVEGIASNIRRPSRTLQALVEAVVVLDNALSNKVLDTSVNASSPSSAPLPSGVVLHRLAQDSDCNTTLNVTRGKNKSTGRFLVWLPPQEKSTNIELSEGRVTARFGPVAGDGNYRSIMSEYGFESGVHAFHITINSFADVPPVIGIALPAASMDQQIGSNRFSIGWGGQRLFVNGEPGVSFGPKMTLGDVISVEINMTRGTVTFYRNEAFVGIAVGPPKSGAEMEMVLGRGPFHPAVSMCALGDSVSFATVSAGLKELISDSPSDSKLPSWVLPLKESVTLLRSCSMRELPASVIESTFVPQVFFVSSYTHPSHCSIDSLIDYYCFFLLM